MASLYRKWRSRSFDDLVGQDHVVRTLRNAVQHGRVAHAYLFTGPRGTGKTSTARILAKAVNCTQPCDGSPCNVCDMCRAADDGRAVDVIEIDAASNTSVDNVRELRDRVGYAAGEGRYKVYIVDEVHRLSGAAFDAFLKTLEEPPPHVIFVFASTEPHKVPETIMSRCQRLDFKRISPGETLARLQYVAREEKLDVSEDALVLVAQHAHGSLRDALVLLDQVSSYSQGTITDAGVRSALGLADSALVGKLTDALLEHNPGEGLMVLHEFVAAGGEPAQLTRQFLEYWRALLLQVSGAKSVETLVDPALKGPLSTHASRLDQGAVVAVLKAMADQQFSSKFNVPSELPFELGYVQADLATRTPDAAQPGVSGASPPSSLPQAVRSESPPVKVQSSVVDTPADIPALPSPPGNLPATDGAVRAPSVSGDLDTAWPQIVAVMGTRSRMLQAILRDAHVMRAQDGEIVVGFWYDFHKNKVAEPKHRKILEEAVEEVLGVSYHVTCTRVTKEEVAAVKGPGSVAADDGFVDEVAQRLRDYHVRQFGGGQI